MSDVEQLAYLNAPATPIHVTSTEIMVSKQCCSRQKQTRPFETCFAAVAQLFLYVYIYVYIHRATPLTRQSHSKKKILAHEVNTQVHPDVNTCAESIIGRL